jgi:hypothetical protein
MVNDIIPYKQSLSHSCLVADFLMLLKAQYGIEFNEGDEKEVLLNGMNRKYMFYVIGVPKAVYEKYGKQMSIVVDNQYFTDQLIREFKDKKNFNIYHKKITIRLIRELLDKRPLICHIDDNLLGDYSHASHFIILEKASDKMIKIVDPFYGKSKLISEKTLEASILSLKNHIKMCPLLYYFD